MKVLMTAGGTAGHINPALAIAGYIKNKHPDADIRFAGTPDGMECDLVKKEGYAFYPVRISGFHRRISLENLVENLKTLKRAALSLPAAGKILSEFKPDVVIGTGGYVSWPVLYSAAKRKIPTATHESNAYPGIVTKMLAGKVDVVMLRTMETQKRLKPGSHCVLTGMPIRDSIVMASRETSRARLGIGEEPMILSFGGSLGAMVFNQAVAGFMALCIQNGTIVHHVHGAGRYGVDWMRKQVKNNGADASQNPKLDIRDYVYDMDLCLSAADVVICRSGASTLCEIEVQGRPSILIPSPNVTENHQYYNALVLQQADAAVLIEEKDLTAQRLYDEVFAILGSLEKQRSMSRAAAQLAVVDSGERIYDTMMSLLRQR